MRSSFGTTALALLLLPSPSPRVAFQASGPGASSPVAQVEIPDTQQRRMTSAAGQQYVLYVHLPTGYSDGARTYPVLYLLDAHWDFPLVVGLVESLTDDGFVPPLIIVGITWGGKDPDYGHLRFRDLTPTNNPRFPQSGAGATFLRFIKKELIPLIESEYRVVKTDRTLMGNSLGGLFGLYALFSEPGLFNRYVLSSPNLSFAGGVAPYERKYALTASELPVRLFVSVGDVEGPHVSQDQEFAALLRSRHYRGLDLQTLIVKTAGHSSNKPEGFVRGLQAIFAPKPVAIDEAILDRYVGKYQFPGFTEEVVKERGELFVVVPEGTRFLLNPTSEKDFYTRGMYMAVHFKSNEAGKTVGMEVEQPVGHVFVVEKIS